MSELETVSGKRLTAHCLPLTAHCSLANDYCLLITNYSLFRHHSEFQGIRRRPHHIYRKRAEVLEQEFIGQLLGA